MSAIITGIAVGVAGLGTGIASGVMSSNAQKDSASSAKKSQKDTNALNYQMFNEGRGSTGSAVLPLYLKNPDGTPFEGSLGNDLIKTYNDTNVPLSRFTDSTGALASSRKGAVDFTNGIFNGDVTNTLLKNQAPVAAARTAGARYSSLDALHKTLDSIDAAQAGKGFEGDSYANRMLKFAGYKAQGDAQSGANLDNLQEQQQIRDYGDVQLPLSSLSLPFQMTQQNANSEFAGQDAYLNSVAQRIQPFNFMKLNPGQFTYQPLPTPGPGAYSGTANALSAVAGAGSQIGGSALNYYLQQNQQQNIMDRIQQMQAGNIASTAAANSFYPMSGLGSAAAPALTGALDAGAGPLATTTLGGSFF